jgi:hypothetical protein
MRLAARVAAKVAVRVAVRILRMEAPKMMIVPCDRNPANSRGRRHFCDILPASRDRLRKWPKCRSSFTGFCRVHRKFDAGKPRRRRQHFTLRGAGKALPPGAGERSGPVPQRGFFREPGGSLNNHPRVLGLRELLISYGKSGYVALYSYEQRQDVVLVLAIPHQREAGYST